MAQTALGARGTTSDLTIAVDNRYSRLLLRNSESAFFAAGRFTSAMLTYELQLLKTKFALRPERSAEGQRLRLVLRGISDIFILE